MRHFEVIGNIKEILVDHEIIKNEPMDEEMEFDVSDMEILDSVELVLDFESEFDIEIGEEQWDSLKTISDLIKLIKERQQCSAIA